MATLYLHLGTPKTGTTAIQFFLYANRELLATRGICYPDMGIPFVNVGPQRNGHFLVAPFVDDAGHTDSTRLGKKYGQGLDKLTELANEYDKIIVSDETIWRTSKFIDQYWTNLKKDLDARGIRLKVILYFRRQDLWIQSLWAQKVKKVGVREKFQDYLVTMKEQGYPTDYYGYLNMLSEIYGKDALIVRVYEKGQFRGEEKNLFSDFLDIFHLSISDGFDIEQEVYNTRLDGYYLEIKRILNNLPMFEGEKHMLVRVMKRIQNENPLHDIEDTEFSYFTPEERRQFLADCAEANEKLAREYLGREDGILFYDEIQDCPTFTADEEAMLQSVIVAYGAVIDKLFSRDEHFARQDEKLLEKNRQLAAQNRELAKRTKQLENDILELRKYSVLYRLKELLKKVLKRSNHS